MQNNNISLTTLNVGDSGTITEIHGGDGVKHRLAALGLRIGTKITKVSTQMMKGPVTIKAGSTQVAIGYGMAHKIEVSIS